MRKRKEEPKVQPVEEKFLDVNATMQGTLRFDDPVNLRINGKFEGTLDTKGKLMIGEKANIRANINGEIVSIAGNVTGNIKATSSLRLDNTAKLTGDIETPQIAIQQGALLNGQVNMGASSSAGGSGRNDMLNVSQVADYLEVDTNKVNEWANSGMLPGSKENGSWVFEKNKLDQWVAQGKVKA